MRMRSTGLGKTELKGKFVDIEMNQDLMILHIETYDPVKWHLRAGIQRSDRWTVIKMLLKLNVKIIPYLWRWKDHTPPREPEEI